MRAKTGRYNYGKCHVCGEKMIEKHIKQDFWLRGRLVVIEDVPAGVCVQCGEKVVRAAVGQQIATLVEDSPRIRRARTLSVPVLRFAETGC
jgi:YgiT-type zinc finger domain-containing protein